MQALSSPIPDYYVDDLVDEQHAIAVDEKHKIPPAYFDRAGG